MPFQPIPFAGITPIGRPALANLGASLAQGMQLGQLPSQLRRKAQSEDLANRLSQIRADYLPETLQSDIQLKQRQAQRQQALLSAMPQELQSRLALQSAQAQKARQEAWQKEILGQFLAQQLGGVGTPVETSASATPPPSSRAMPSDISLPQVETGVPTPSKGGPSQLGQILMRRQLGIPAELPTEKQARELETFKQKERFRKELTGPETGRFKTLKQSSALGLETTFPLLDKLIAGDVPSQVALWGDPLTTLPLVGNPDQQAQYEGRISAITDTLVAAMGLPKSNESLHTIRRMVARQPWESEGSYKRRLKELKSDLTARHRNLKGMVEMRAPNGATYSVPPDKIKEAMRRGAVRVK